MVISHTHKIIFLKARKVAGTSFEIALSKFLGADDVVTPIIPGDEQIRTDRNYVGAQNYLKETKDIFLHPRWRDVKALRHFRRPNQFFNHISAKEVFRTVSNTLWNEYTKVAIVRNPWDCAISYFYHYNGRGADLGTFEEWCLTNQFIFGLNAEQYLINDKLIVDKFIRYEAFEEDISSLEGDIPELEGLWDTFKSINAKGGLRVKSGPSVLEIFSHAPKAGALVREAHTFEIEKFGYALQA